MTDAVPAGMSHHSGALTRVTDDVNLIDSLRRIAAAGCALLGNCAAASVTVIAGSPPVTMAATDDIANGLDHAQYVADDGSCLSAARQRHVVRIDTIRNDTRWPIYRQAAIDADIASSLSVPLIIADPDTFGGLNAYSATVAGFSAQDEQIAETFAAQAAIAVSNVVAYWSSFDQTRNLTAALEHRPVIEQAKGILMALHRCTPDEAFTLLRQRSQTENRILRDVAVAVVADTQTGRPDQP